MNVSRAIRKLAMAAAVSVAALPMLAQAFISVSTVNDAENLVESTLTLGGNTLGSASFSRLNGLRLESLDRTGAPASVGDTALAYNNHNELTGYGSGTGSDFAYTRDAGTGWIEGVGSSGSHVRDDSLSVERDAAGWITRESGNRYDIAYEYRDDGVRTATVQHGRRCVHAVTAAGAPAFRRGAEPVGRFRAPEESSGDYYIVGPLPGQYPCISNALDAVYADYGSTSFPSRVTVLLETNALAEAVALDAAVWPLAPASGAELVVRGQRGGTALTGSLDVRGIAHVRLERLLLSGGTTFTNAPSATLRNSVADAPVAFFGVDGAVVAGCTFVYTNGLAAVAVTNSPAALFRDNLVLGGGGACGAVLDAATVTADHNAWWPVAPPALGTGDVFADPLVDGDYWISSPLSPLVRTGVSMSGLDADIAGMRRYASAPCIGAHEYGIEEVERDTEGRVSRRVFNGRACEYAYDAYGRLISFADVAAGTAAAYEYDFAGRRVGMAVDDARTVMVYDWGGHDVVHETHDANGDGDLNDSGDYRRTYWVLPEIDRRIGFVDELPGGATETYWYVCDANGSVHAVVDADGTVANRYAYDSFGMIDWDWSYETVPNRYTFQGREYDAERGDYHFRNRVYMPEWGLFSGPDMNLAAGPYGEPHGMMSYVFCGNDPWTYADPMGLAFGDWWDYRTHAFIAEGFFGGMRGGASVTANTLTFGGSDKIGLTDSDQYQGGAYTVSRVSATIAREALITAGTMGIGNAARGGSIVAQGAHKLILGIDAGTGGYQVGTGINKIGEGENLAGALDILGGGLRVGGSLLCAREVGKWARSADAGDAISAKSIDKLADSAVDLSPPARQGSNGIYPIPTKRGVRWKDSVTGKFIPAPKKGLTMIGHSSYNGTPGYVEIAQKHNATFFRVSDRTYTKWMIEGGREKVWSYNRLYLEEALRRGDEFGLATELHGPGFFADELRFLKEPLREMGLDISLLTRYK